MYLIDYTNLAVCNAMLLLYSHSPNKFAYNLQVKYEENDLSSTILDSKL